VVVWGAGELDVIGSSRRSLGNVRELTEYFVARKDRLFADATGCNLFREVDGLQHAVAIIWAVSPPLVELHGGMGFTAPADRETQVALALTRLNSRVKVSGFRMLPPVSGQLHFTYTNYLFLDDEGRVGTAVLESALSNVLEHMSKLGPELQRVAKGGTVE
jgi:hypothetical protein